MAREDVMNHHSYGKGLRMVFIYVHVYIYIYMYVQQQFPFLLTVSVLLQVNRQLFLVKTHPQKEISLYDTRL